MRHFNYTAFDTIVLLLFRGCEYVLLPNQAALAGWVSTVWTTCSDIIPSPGPSPGPDISHPAGAHEAQRVRNPPVTSRRAQRSLYLSLSPFSQLSYVIPPAHPARTSKITAALPLLARLQAEWGVNVAVAVRKLSVWNDEHALISPGLLNWIALWIIIITQP